MSEEYSNLVDIAFQMHKAGKLDDAKAVYTKLLSLRPDDVNVQNLYAQLCFSLKNYDEALKYFKLVYEKTNLNDVLINIAKVYYSIADYANVIDILSKNEKINVEEIKLLAYAYIKTEDFNSAIDVYKKLISSNLMTYNDYYNLFFSYKKINDTENALKTALITEKYNPRDVGLLYNIALLYKDMDNAEKAIEYFSKVTAIEPDNKYAIFNIAILYQTYNQKISANIFEYLLKNYPDDELILSNILITYYNIADYKNACDIGKKLVQIYPDNIDYYLILGESYISDYKYEDAEVLYKQAMEKFGRNESLILEYSYVINLLGRREEAEKIYIEYKDNPLFTDDYMFFMLKEKKFNEIKETFFKHIYTSDIIKDNKLIKVFYKYNLDKKYAISEKAFIENKNKVKNTSFKFIKEKVWKNEDIKGKKLLVYSGEGVGDLLMFSRYIDEVKKMAGEVMLAVNNSCLDLFKYNFPDLKVFSLNDKIPESEYDYCASFFGLIYNLNIDLNNINTTDNYLKVDDKLVQEKASLVKTNKKKIGIYWQGNPTLLSNRSMKLHNFEELFKLENTQIYSFQISKIDSESENEKKKYPIIDLAPYIKNYTDTAALLKNIDLLVTIDTSIAHLAGALGIKTFLLLPYSPEWRWFYDNNTTPWYNSVKIFKQVIPNDWYEVINRVKNECTL